MSSAAAAQGRASSVLQPVPWDAMCSAPTDQLLHAAACACQELGRRIELVEDVQIAGTWMFQQVIGQTILLLHAEYLAQLLQHVRLHATL